MIGLLDAWRLRLGLRQLTHEDPARARRVRRRAQRLVARFEAGFPGDFDSGRIASDDEAEERFSAGFADEACPCLDPVTESCDLYRARPLACRTFGLPVRFDDEWLPPCRLCFTHASPAEVLACCAEPDPDGTEFSITARFLVEDPLSWETYVELALLRTLPRWR